MLRRALFRIIILLITMGLSLCAPIFAAKTVHSTKTHHQKVAAQTHTHKTKPTQHQKKLTSHQTKSHHSKAISHHHHHPTTTALQNNPQDYAPVNNKNLATNIIPTSSTNNQDLVNGGFNQQMSARLASSRDAVCANAQAQVGKPYQWGVEDPNTGFDCSGLSQFVYAQEGIQIPRTALEQYQSLQPVKHLQEGDLVFFRTHPHSRKVSHVGIYVGDGYFVHSPRTGESIRMSRLSDSYWHQHYAGARRVLTKQTVANTVALNKITNSNENS